MLSRVWGATARRAAGAVCNAGQAGRRVVGPYTIQILFNR